MLASPLAFFAPPRHDDMRIPRRIHFLTSFAVVLLANFEARGAERPAQATGDHVLVVTIDDLNDWISCLHDREAGRGHPQASTPNLDRLAQRGVLFTNAHCQAPICNPSRTSFLSGLRPSTTGVYANHAAFDAKARLRPGADVPWLPDRFRQAGYQTFAAGKLLHGGTQGLGGKHAPPSGQGPYPKQKVNVPANVTPNAIWDYGALSELERFTDWQIAQWTIGQIDKPLSAGEAPRFIALGFYRPHVPLFAPKRWFDATPALEDIVLAPAPADDLDDVPAIARRMSSRSSYIPTTDWVMADEARMRGLTQAYLACTSAMDHCLGDVIDALDRSDMADTTWVVVFSDHGWHLGEKDHIAKMTLWEPSSHVPLIIVPPKRLTEAPRDVRCDRPVELLDVYPTLLDATGLPAAPSDDLLEGLSLLQWLQNPDAARDRPALTTLYSGNHSLCDERYRYTRYADGSEELYDRVADPHEHDNLIIAKVADRPELQAAINRLAGWIPKDQAGPPDRVLPLNEK